MSQDCGDGDGRSAEHPEWQRCFFLAAREGFLTVAIPAGRLALRCSYTCFCGCFHFQSQIH